MASAPGAEYSPENPRMDAFMESAEAKDARQRRRRLALRIVSFALWGLVLAFYGYPAITEPTTSNVAVALTFVALFLLANLQLFAVAWSGQRREKALSAKLRASGYLSEEFDLPNRNYLLAELRREMPHSRDQGVPFSLVILSLADWEGVKERRGEEFARRAAAAFADLLRRITRGSDFLAHLEGATFAVLLSECSFDQAFEFLKRVPGSIGVSDGRRVLDVAITARLTQYDMESLYATDVLREAEQAQPLRRREEPRPWAEAA